MYLTRVVEIRGLKDVGELLRSSRFIIFIRLGALRSELSDEAENALLLRAEGLSSPVIDCDVAPVGWLDMRHGFEQFGKVIEELDDERPFLAILHTKDLLDVGAEFVPCHVWYVDASTELPEVADTDEAVMDAFGRVYQWAIREERSAALLARAGGVLALLKQLVSVVRAAT